MSVCVYLYICVCVNADSSDTRPMQCSHFTWLSLILGGLHPHVLRYTNAQIHKCTKNAQIQECNSLILGDSQPMEEN